MDNEFSAEVVNQGRCPVYRGKEGGGVSEKKSSHHLILVTKEDDTKVSAQRTRPVVAPGPNYLLGSGQVDPPWKVYWWNILRNYFHLRNQKSVFD